MKRLRFLNAKQTLFMLCDVQEAFRPVIPIFDNLIKNSSKLIKAGKEFDIPLIASEQYPEKLGKTVCELEIDHAKCVFPKTMFSMCVPEVQDKMKELFDGKFPCDVVLFGIEAHVCVEQTSISLLEQNINVLIAADCVASRLTQDRDLALARLRDAGCTITTTESIIFNIMRDKNNPKFNNIRKLVKDPSLDMKLSQSEIAKL